MKKIKILTLAAMLTAGALPGQSLRDGIVAEWNFDETSGLEASDSVGSNNGALIDFGPDNSHWIAGVHGGGLAFSGANYIEVPDDASIGADLVNGFSMATWFRSNVELGAAAGSSNRMLEKGNSYFFLQGVADGGMNFLVKVGGANRTAGIGETLAPNVWHHIVGVYDGQDAHVYLNGEHKATVAAGAAIDDAQLPLRIGSDDSGNFFDGAMDQLVIWNRALNSEEVTAVFNNEFDIVADQAPTINESPESQELYEGGTILLSVNASGQRPFRYLWYKDGEPIRTATESSLAIDNVTAEDAGSYHVRVSNAGGEIQSAAASVTILPVTGIESGRLAYWRFNESGGNTSADASGNNNNGNLNGATFVDGRFDKAISFDGTASYVEVADSNSLNELGPEASFSFWLNLNSYGVEQDASSFTRSTMDILRKGDHFAVRVINDPGTITRTISARAGTGADTGSVPRKGFEANAPQGSVELNTWQHFSVVFKGGMVQFYLDGIPVGAPSEGSLGDPDFSSLILGSFDGTPDYERFLDGQIDDLAIWDRPLGEAEILELADKDVAGPPAVEVQPVSQKKLEGTTVSFKVIATGKRPVSYQWTRNDQPLEGATDNTLTLKRLSPDDAGIYAVTITNDQGSTRSDGAELEVEALGAITSGLVAHFTFDEDSGDVINDSSGNDLHGTLSNFDGTERENGVIGGSLRFDGIDDFGTIPHSDLLTLGTEATISVWLNPFLFSGGSDFDRVFRKDVNYDFVLINGGVARVHGINKTPYSSPAGTVISEQWQHFAYVARNGTVQWYRNGVAVGNELPAQLGEANTLPLTLGNYEAEDGNWINRPYQGGMDDLGIWQRALTATELEGIYQNGLQGKPLTEEFEPLNIRSIDITGSDVTLIYYNPFANRELFIQGSANLSGEWEAIEAEATDLGEGVWEITLSEASNARFYRVGALAPPPIFEEDFESGTSGWQHDGFGDNWELGSPASGPGQAFSGDNVYATGLNDNFLPFADAFLQSPVIDLSDYNQATLSFWEFRAMDPPEGDTFFHGGRVRIVDAETLLPLQELSVLGGTTNGWEQRTNRLGPDAVGRRVRIEFNFFSDDFNPNEGWFIDDIKLIAE